MTIIINVVIFLAIISYVVLHYSTFSRKLKAGKCSSCGSMRGCHTGKKHYDFLSLLISSSIFMKVTAYSNLFMFSFTSKDK